MQPDALVDGLRQVAAGARLSLGAFRIARTGNRSSSLDYHAEDLSTMLTAREREIVNLVSEGLSSKEVGWRLKLTPGTIKVHLHNIFSKLGIKNRSTLAASVVSQRCTRSPAEQQDELPPLFVELLGYECAGVSSG